jgi:hypothetical protein
MERGMMREHEQTKIQLSIVQVIAGALASVSAALVASTFGLKGTLLGAAITSIVASVGGALYSHSLHRARARIQTRFNPYTGAIERVVIRPPRTRRPIRWGKVAGVAGLLFVLAMGAITLVEVAARRPVAALVGSASPQHGGTTVGALLQDAPGAAPIVIPAIPMTPTPAGTATATPHGTPAPSPPPGQTAVATLSGTASVRTPSQTPATVAATATRVRSLSPTPTTAAHTPTATPRTGTTPTPQPTAAKSPSTTATAPVGSSQPLPTAVGTPPETPQP